MTEPVGTWKRYGKAFGAAVGAVGLLVLAALRDNHVDPIEGVAIGSAALSAALMYLVPIMPGARYGKAFIGGGLAVLSLGVQVLAQPWSQANLSMIIWTFLLGAGLVVAPTVSDNGARQGIGT